MVNLQSNSERIDIMNLEQSIKKLKETEGLYNKDLSELFTLFVEFREEKPYEIVVMVDRYIEDFIFAIKDILTSNQDSIR
jgi:hypothetical protein